MLVCLCCVVCLGAALPPIPPKPKLPPKKRHYKSGEVPRGTGAKALISKVSIPVSRTNVFLWTFPQGLHPEIYFWNIEQSTDLAHWSVLVSNASGVSEVRVLRTEPARVYRLCGRMYP